LLDRFLGGADAGAHHHDHALGVRGADVVEQVVLRPVSLANLSIVSWTIAGAAS
jgi:hypothetical protein